MSPRSEPRPDRVEQPGDGGRTGPSPDYTPEVLAILRRHDLKATFCLVGRNVAAYPDVAKAVAADGSRTVAAIRTYLPRLLRLGYRFVLP